MQEAGTKRTGVPVKTLKKLLKKAGLKVSGKKATLTRRAKRAKLFGGAGGIGSIKGMPAVVLSTEQQTQKDELLKGKAEFEAATAKTRADAAATKQEREVAHKKERADSFAKGAQIKIPQGPGTSGSFFGGKNKRSRRS